MNTRTASWRRAIMHAMALDYEFDTYPELGDLQSIRDDLQWLRMPLPFMLGHINLWLLDDGEGFAIVDTGIDSGKSRGVWERVLGEMIAQRPLTRVFATHLHPDHIGCAGWLCAEHGVDLWMSREEYLLSRILIADTGRPAPQVGIDFYRAAGFPADALERYIELFGMFGRHVAPMPESYVRLIDGDLIDIGEHSWAVIVGRGHSPEHACLFDADRNLLISGDQILPTISSNVSVYPTEPHANPLKDWIDSLTAMKHRIPEDVLVLPAHGKPFRGAHARIDALIEEHTTGLGKLYDLCAEPRRAIDVFPALFKGRITAGNMIMATGESIAHLNFLLAEGSMTAEFRDGELWYRSA